MTSRPTVARKYECDKCKDTGFIETPEHKYRVCECQELDYVRRLWQSFGVKPEDVKKLKDYKPYDVLTTDAKNNAIKYIENFDTLEDMKGFALLGQAGSGKTHIVIAIGAALINRPKSPVPVVYMPYLEVMRELKANVRDEEQYNKIMWRYQRAKVLIIDDLFKDKVKNGSIIPKADLTGADLNHIYPIINHRYLNNLPTIISCECTPNMLIDLDEAIAGRILEMCSNYMTVFEGKKYNFRMRKFIKEVV